MKRVKLRPAVGVAGRRNMAQPASLLQLPVVPEEPLPRFSQIDLISQIPWDLCSKDRFPSFSPGKELEYGRRLVKGQRFVSRRIMRGNRERQDSGG